LGGAPKFDGVRGLHAALSLQGCASVDLVVGSQRCYHVAPAELLLQPLRELPRLCAVPDPCTGQQLH
jgi:hypothetical protein